MQKDSLFVMKINLKRYEYMLDLGWFCSEYSEQNWQEFKKYEKELRERHPNPEYHLKNQRQLKLKKIWE